MHSPFLIDVVKFTINFMALLMLASGLALATAPSFDVVGGRLAHEMEGCPRCSYEDEGTVSLWSNFSALESRSATYVENRHYEQMFGVRCEAEISVRGGRLSTAEFGMGLLIALERGSAMARVRAPIPSPGNVTAKSSATCTLCDRGNFAVDTSEDAFVELDRLGYAVDRVESEEGDKDTDATLASPPPASLLISFVDDHFVRDWGALERVYERPVETEPVTGLESAHWHYSSSVVRPHGVSAPSKLWLYFQTSPGSPLHRAESQDDGLSWSASTAVQVDDAGSQRGHVGVSANRNPRRQELGEPDYFLVVDCPTPIKSGNPVKRVKKAWVPASPCLLGSANGLNFTLIARPATSSWAKRDFQLADTVNQVLWCPKCQSHVLSSSYAPQSPLRWRAGRGMGFWRATNVTAKDPMFDFDTWVQFDMQDSYFEMHLRQMDGASGSWIDGIYHGIVLVHTTPHDRTYAKGFPRDRLKAYFFTTRDMRNFTFTSVYARRPLVGHDLDMWSTVVPGGVVRTSERWGHLYASLPVQRAVLKGDQTKLNATVAMAWWEPHRMSGLGSAAKIGRHDCFSFLTTKWLRLDSELRANLTEPAPVKLQINCKCVEKSDLDVVVRARLMEHRPYHGKNERIIATSKPIRGDLLRAPVHWLVTETGTPHVMVDFSREQFSLSFKINGDCTIYSVWLEL